MKLSFPAIYLALVAMLVSYSFAVGQQDSLVNVLDKTNGIEKTDVLLKLVEQTRMTHPKKAIEYGQQALHLCNENKHPEIVAEAYSGIGYAYGRLREYDSLLNYQKKARKLWQKAGNKEQHARSNRLMAYYYITNAHYDTALSLIGKAKKQYKQVNHIEGQVLCLQMQGDVSRGRADYKNAITLYNNALKLSQKHNTQHLDGPVLNSLGLAYVNMGLDDKAMEYYYQAVRVYEKYRPQSDIPIQYLNISWVLMRRGDYESALNYTEKYYEIVSKHEVPFQLITYKLNSAFLYKNLDQLEKAESYAMDVLDYYHNKKKHNMEFLAIEVLGQIYARQSNYNKAIRISKKGLATARKVEFHSWEHDFLNYIAEYHFKNTNYDSSMRYLRESLKGSMLAKEYDNVKDTYQYLSKIHESLHQNDSALYYYKLYNQYSDSISTEETETKIAGLHIQYETELKEQQIKRLRLKNNLNKLTIRKQYYAGAAIGVGLLSVVLISIVLYRSRRKQEKINHWLEEKVQERTLQLREANHNLENAYKELQSLDVAKNSFLNMISHEIRTPLNGIVGITDFLKDSLNQDPELRQFIDMLTKSVDRLERFSTTALIITQLQTGYPLKKQKINIGKLIDECIFSYHDQARKKGVSFEALSKREQWFINADKNLLARLLHSIIENAVRYSPENGIIRINLVKEDGHIKITCADKGEGFSQKALNNLFKPFGLGEEHYDKSLGLSLKAAKLIMEIHSGEIKVKNLKEGGARVELFFPSKLLIT